MSEETHTINPDEPPFYTGTKWRRQITGPVTVSFPYDPTGLLVSSAAPSVNGAATALHWEMFVDSPETMRLAGVDFPGATGAVYFAMGVYASSIPGVVAEDGFSRPTGFDKVDGSGSLYRLTNPPMFNPDDITDFSEWTGTVEYH